MHIMWQLKDLEIEKAWNCEKATVLIKEIRGHQSRNVLIYRSRFFSQFNSSQFQRIWPSRSGRSPSFLVSPPATLISITCRKTGSWSTLEGPWWQSEYYLRAARERHRLWMFRFSSFRWQSPRREGLPRDQPVLSLITNCQRAPFAQL